MTALELTPIDTITSENLTTIKPGINRTWKITTLVSAVINVALLTIITIMVFKKNNSNDTTNELIITTISMKTSSHNDLSFNSSIQPTTTKGDLIFESSEYIIIPSTDVPEFDPIYYGTYPLSILSKLNTISGFSLNHSLFFNIRHSSSVQGYVTSIALRLCTNWKGNDLLYIYAIDRYSFGYDQIKYRYSILPKRNNTDWQTISIPLRHFPILKDQHLAVGMQDENNHTNQICALSSSISIHGKNIRNDTQEFLLEVAKGFQGVAFTYTVLEDDEEGFV